LLIASSKEELDIDEYDGDIIMEMKDMKEKSHQ
jgi:hypothetical protein